MDVRENLRNIAIIAHVDHGKTTLVDQLLKQSGVFRANENVEERVMDSNDLERERGITILSKPTAVMYNGIKINIVDTPGHADFGGEVERILQMVDGVVLLVDAFEGCMPQTRFVLKKALGLGKKPLVVLNKIDRPGARPEEVVDEVLDLFIELCADEDQLEFPVIYASARDGYASEDYLEPGTDMKPLFDAIVKEIPAPQGDMNGGLQLLISNIDSDKFVGRIGVGRVERGTAKNGQAAVLCHTDGTTQNVRIAKLYQFEGLKRVECDTATLGDIVCVSGVQNINIGETICSNDCVEPLPFVKIDEPTVSMNFIVNNSPFAGREGKFVTSRQIRERLYKELLKDVSLRVTDSENSDSYNVAGRGEMHLSILIETMRRDDNELSVKTHREHLKKIDGVRCEPIERLLIDVPDNCVGSVMEKMGVRKAELVHMQPIGNRTRIEFLIPSRGLFGYRSEFMTDTKGEGVLNTVFDSYRPYMGEIPTRTVGSLVAFESGTAMAYGLFNAQERGTLFIDAGVPVYEGMVVGVSPKAGDINVNVCKKKHLTNTRASGSDDALRLIPYKRMSLEESLEFINDDELVEVTPKTIRIRKKILDNDLRAKEDAKRKKQNA